MGYQRKGKIRSLVMSVPDWQ